MADKPKRKESVTARLTTTELWKLKRIADSKDVSVSSFLRALAIDAIRSHEETAAQA
jgi:hypothetical protein